MKAQRIVASSEPMRSPAPAVQTAERWR
jgi:hypothetical protein